MPARLRRGAAALALAAGGPALAPAQECRELRLDPVERAAEVSGRASAEGGACLSLTVGEGQRARFQVLEGDVVFRIDGVIEGQEDYAFVAEGGAYRIRVEPLGPAASEPFLLRVALAADRVGAPGGWRVEEGEGGVRGLAWIGEEGGPSFVLTCGRPGPALAMTYDGLGTAALARDDATRAGGVVEIEVGGAARRHAVTLERIDGFDRYWEVVEGLTPALLDDFAAGERMRLLDAEGSVAGAVGLGGSAGLREAIARGCGL